MATCFALLSVWQQSWITDKTLLSFVECYNETEVTDHILLQGIIFFSSSGKVMVNMHAGGVKTNDIALQSCHGGETSHLATDTWVQV